MEDRKVLLSLKNVWVKFNVRGRILTAIRGVSLDIYENESIAIVGESGSGKSVLTKTFAGMLDSNGFISEGTITLNDDEISETNVALTKRNRRLIEYLRGKLNDYSKYESGAEKYREIKRLETEIRDRKTLSEQERAAYDERIKDLDFKRVDTNNYLLTLDTRSQEDKAEIERCKAEIASCVAAKEALLKEIAEKEKAQRAAFAADKGAREGYKRRIDALKAEREKLISGTGALTPEREELNRVIACEIMLSIGRYPLRDQARFLVKLLRAFKKAMIIGEDLSDPNVRNVVFRTCVFRVEYRSWDEQAQLLRGYAVIDCAQIKYTKDWQQIRGCRIATVFQDPMTSLNPVLTIGKQIMMVILKHQKCSQAEAKKRTIDIMGKVGIPDPEKRFDDYPFQYSGGMRQRIVIAIALSCQPKILICDEPTTALDVTIQAQIIRLIKDLQKELGYTTVYITHDLGVVANVAERVAVLYAGQIVEIGTVEEIFYEPRHPYTWALLSSMPQLAEKGSDLFSIPGTPPSLYNKITGDAFAPRNSYAMAIDLKEDPPMFKISDTHYAKTWLLDPRAPKVETPKIIQNLHEKMAKSYVNVEG